MSNKKRNLKRMAVLMAIVLTSAAVINSANGLTIWRFSDGTTEKTIEITTAPGSNSDAKITVPVGTNVENIKLKLKQKVFSTRYIWIPLSNYDTDIDGAGPDIDGSDKIAQIDVSDGHLIRLWDSGNNPSRLAVSPDGNEVWVANRDSMNVTKIDISAGTSTSYPVMAGPRGVTFDHDGNVWVGGANAAMKLDRNGNILLTLNAASADPYLISFTYGADTDQDGYVWFVSRELGGQVVRIDPSNCNAISCNLDDYYTGSAQNYGMGIDSGGDVWVAGSWDNKIFRVKGSSSGSVGTRGEILFPGRLPRGIAVDSQDNVWFADWNNATYPTGSVVKYNPSTGSSTTYQYPNANGPLGVSISIEETPPASGNFIEYVWVVNQYTSNVTKLRASNGAVVGTYCADGNNTFVSGKYSSGLQFSGVNSVDVGNGANLNAISNTMTAEAWIRISANSGSHIIDNINGGFGDGGWFLRLNEVTPGPYALALEYWQTGAPGATGGPLTTPQILQNNIWYHVVGVINTSLNYMKVYVDGTERASGNAPGQIGPHNDPFRISYPDWGTSGLYFNGIIDEVRVYNRALSAAEITEHYNNIFTDNTGLAGYWNFNEGSGIIVNDSSGNNNNGITPCRTTNPYNYSNMTGFRGPITELDIGNDGSKEWSVASYIAETELNSASIASVLTSLASTCTCLGCALSGSDCTIDLTFSSTLMGTIELSSIRAEAPGSIGRFGDLPPPEEIAAGAPTNFEKAIMSIINAILGFASIIAVLAMIFAAGLSLTAGVTGDPKIGLLSQKTITYVLAGITIMGIAYAIARVIVAVVVR